MFWNDTDQNHNKKKQIAYDSSSHWEILRVKCQCLSVNQFLHLFLRKGVLLEVEAEWSRADRFITDVIGERDWRKTEVDKPPELQATRSEERRREPCNLDRQRDLRSGDRR
ncbi:hypothetical protein U1Q18_004413 [Sarracenia purpurea var. burkii]